MIIPFIEAVLIISLCLFIISISIRYWRTNKYLQISGMLVACYFAIGIGIFLLPRSTWVHHWVMGTPFQYLAIAFALLGLLHQVPTRKYKKILFRITLSITIAVLILRLPGVIFVQQSLIAGNSSSEYDQSFSRIAKFAKKQIGNAIFVAADWGTAIQVYCLSNGQPDLVYEPFRSMRSAKDVKVIIEQTDKNVLYLITRRLEKPIFPKNTDCIINEVKNSKLWKEVLVDSEVKNLHSVKVRKFIRSL
jgi:hypothetical protein